MEFLYRNAIPAYKGFHPQQASSSFPSGIVSSLFASGTPCYNTTNGKGASASAPARSWWRAWNLTPVYKTAPSVACVDESEVSPDDGGAAANADGCVNANDQAPQVVIL